METAQTPAEGATAVAKAALNPYQRRVTEREREGEGEIEPRDECVVYFRSR